MSGYEAVEYNCPGCGCGHVSSRTSDADSYDTLHCYICGTLMTIPWGDPDARVKSHTDPFLFILTLFLILVIVVGGSIIMGVWP